jgi:hypothetical protein
MSGEQITSFLPYQLALPGILPVDFVVSCPPECLYKELLIDNCSHSSEQASTEQRNESGPRTLMSEGRFCRSS